VSPLDADVLVIGSGPAGLQAAIHAARAKVGVVVLGKIESSAAYSVKMENYFGLPKTVDGTELLMNGIRQARSFGAEIVQGNIVSASASGGRFEAVLESGDTVTAKAVVIASGVSRVKLGVPGEKELFGKGVSYCASCDCNFYKGKRVAIVGNQSEAAVSAELMTRYASKVYWVAPQMDVDPSLSEKALSAGAEHVASAVGSIQGEGKVEHLLLEDGTSLDVDGVFIELGGRSSADMAMDLGLMPELDDTIAVNRDCSTSVPGIFACGDITGRPWQLAKAVGEGAVAGLSAAAYAKKVSE